MENTTISGGERNNLLSIWNHHDGLCLNARDVIMAMGEPAVQPIIDYLPEMGPTWGMIEAMLEGLGEYGDEKAIPILVNVIQNEGRPNPVARDNRRRMHLIKYNKRQQDAAINAIGKIQHPDVVPALLSLLSNESIKDMNYQVQIIDFLGEKKDIRAKDTLVQYLNHEDHTIRFYSAQALLRIDDRTLFPLFNEAIQGEDTAILPWAVRFVGKYGDGSTVGALLELKKRIGSEAVNEAIDYAMQDLEGAGHVKTYDMSQAKYFESVLRLEDAANIYEQYNMIEDAARVRQIALQPTSVQQQIVAQQVDMSTKTEIHDSVLHKSPVNVSNQKAFQVCPYCGEKLNLPKTPKFCPFCAEQIS